MKISFVGKGGSGKTTVSGLFSKYVASKKLPILAIDADINQHLGGSLGMLEEVLENMPELGKEISKLKNYFRGSNPLIKETSQMIKTTPPGEGSKFFSFNEKNEVFDYFARDVEGVSLMRVGGLTEDDFGVRCYHAKNGSVELILNHFLDTENDYVLVDMTAGADAFASGLFTRFDLTVLVVEPTLKSVSVYNQYKSYASKHNLMIKVVANKVQSKEDLDFIKEHVGKDLISSFSFSSYVRGMERGEINSFQELEEENLMALESIFNELNQQEKDWEKYFNQAVEFHEKNAESWANESVGLDLSQQVDRSFSYKKNFL